MACLQRERSPSKVPEPILEQVGSVELHPKLHPGLQTEAEGLHGIHLTDIPAGSSWLAMLSFQRLAPLVRKCLRCWTSGS